jgi:hypothetical protein
MRQDDASAQLSEEYELKIRVVRFFGALIN